MVLKVTRRQQSSRMCLVCGERNPYGLRTAFLELENGELLALFTPREEHQGYPGVLHGGITTAILDETIGRAVMTKYPEQMWGVTVEMSVRFRKQIPLGQELRVIGRMTKDTRRFFEGTGELLLPDGQVAAEGRGRYMRLPLERITSGSFSAAEWRVTPGTNDPMEVELPDRSPRVRAGTEETG